MKTLCLIPLMAASLLIGCQASSEVSKAEFDALKTDVQALKIAVHGDPRAICPKQKIIDLSAYPDGILEAMEDPVQWHKRNGERKNVVTTASGLQYKIVQSGPENGFKPEDWQIVKVNYHGFFPNGEIFDSSYERGQPIEFPKNSVIKGWVEALGDMKPCDAWQLYIPSDLAYGSEARGPIHKNATLVFNVQLLEIKG